MITTILEKVLGELEKEKPDLSYIRGMIEVLLASQPKLTIPIVTGNAIDVATHQDEAAMMDAKARASIEQIKALGGVEME